MENVPFYEIGAQSPWYDNRVRLVYAYLAASCLYQTVGQDARRKAAAHALRLWIRWAGMNCGPGFDSQALAAARSRTR